MTQWWTGRAKYAIRHEEPAWSTRLTTAVRCRFDDAAQHHWCLLDTGAEFSVFGGAIALALLERTGTGGESTSIHTRHGNVKGTLERLKVSLVAEEGVDLEIDATVLLSRDWPGPPVIGILRMLECVRFALHPDANGDEHWWSFAHAATSPLKP